MSEPALSSYHLLPAAAADMTCLAGNHQQAREYFLQAAAVAANPRDRAVLLRRAAECVDHDGRPATDPDLDRDAGADTDPVRPD